MILTRPFKPSSTSTSTSPSSGTVDEKRAGKALAKRPDDNDSSNRRLPSSVKSASKPVAVPSRPAAPTSMPLFGRAAAQGTRPRRTPTYPASHDSDAISPAVAALLAVTAIPPRKPSRRKPSAARRISIDELVSEWKQDDSLKSSLGTSPMLGMLLEEIEDVDDASTSGKNSFVDDEYPHTRSVSCDSVPSLDGDDLSMFSLKSPSTPGSLHSRKSSSYLRKDKPRSLPEIENCMQDHPLAPSPVDEEEAALCESLLAAPKAHKPDSEPRRSLFKSNLTTSLQALKNAALNSISSLSLSPNSVPGVNPPGPVAPFSDDMLWSHPFLFPRFSPEVRPVINGTPTEAERHYLNPIPLSFEEQEAPFQQALHGPYLAEKVDDAPFIPMQTYSRNRRKSSSSLKRRSGSRSTPDPRSEAGRALLGAVGVRQREVRENGDFLRVVVLEMNMRRQGKIETGRARIWLPPRKTTSCLAEHDEVGEEASRVVPRRWVGETAY